MSNTTPDVIRIKVKKCDGMVQPEYKKLAVDPGLTSYDVLKSLLSCAFGIKNTPFAISYVARDVNDAERYVPLLSDWDLDAAFNTYSHPCLRLKVDLKPFEPGFEDWEISKSVPNESNGSIFGTITSHVEKTMTHVMSKAIGIQPDVAEDDRPALPLPPMTDTVFKQYMDPVGHLLLPREFRLRVYQGGVDPALRGVAWRHLLNIYPAELNGKERFGYGQRLSQEYYRLRDEWRQHLSGGDGADDLRQVINMVKKDVLRTDRAHPFYAGADDNSNVLALFNILVTWAVTHPDIGYVQGMSDLASPILVVQANEAYAYICFCGLMQRLRHNFATNNVAMETKFLHFALLLKHFDGEFFAYLRHQGAEDLLFCYRWLLLELKREFPFEDTLRMLEVMWSSLPPDTPETDLPLCDPDYRSSWTPSALVQRQQRRRTHGDSGRLNPLDKDAKPGEAVTPVDDEEDVSGSQWSEIRTRESMLIVRTSSSIDKSLENTSSLSGSLKDCDDVIAAIEKEISRSSEEANYSSNLKEIEEKSMNFGWLENDIHVEPDISFVAENMNERKLPEPDECGAGNPFLLFLCVTMLLQQRDHIIKRRMDYNELAMHFDKLVRKNHVTAVLLQAQTLYAGYLRRSEEPPEGNLGV